MMSEPLAEPLDVGEVVGGEQHGGALLAVHLDEELAHRLLADHVEPDGRLVEEQDRRVVEQRGGELAAHALAERQLAHGRVEQRAEVEPVGEARRGSRRGGRPGTRYTWRSRSKLSRSGRSHHSCERWPNTTPMRRGQLGALAARLEPVDAHVPAGRHEDAGEHLDGRRLPGAVRADVADHRAALDLRGRCRRRPCTSSRRRRTRPALRCTVKVLARPCDVDDRVVGHVSSRCSGGGGRRCARWRAATTAASSGDERRRPHASSRAGRAASACRASSAGREVGDEGERDDEGEEPCGASRRARRAGTAWPGCRRR